MSLTNPNTVVTEERLAQFYQRILPYLGQSSSGDSKSGGHAIKDEGTDVTQRNTLNLTDFDIADDSTDEETDIAPHRLTAGEMAEIVSPLPTVPVKGNNYSTEEQVIGTWIDGKPLYQKALIDTAQVGWFDIPHNIANVDKVVDTQIGFIHSNAYFKIGCAYGSDAMTASTVGRTNIGIYNSIAAYNGDEVIAIIKYTKTTDVAS